jgi:hypothetical protein
MKNRLLARIAITLLALTSPPAAWASGDIDPSFGVSGTTRLSGYAAYGPQSMVIAGGRVIYAATRPGTADLIVGAVKANGGVDTSFGNAGVLAVTTTGSLSGPVLGKDLAHNAVVLAAADVQGGAHYLLICRILLTGSLDSGFNLSEYPGQSGCVRITSPASAPNGLIPAGVVVDSDGGINVGGSAFAFMQTPYAKVFVAAAVPGGATIFEVQAIYANNVFINGMAPTLSGNRLFLAGTIQLGGGSNPIDNAMIAVRASTITTWTNHIFDLNRIPNGNDEGIAITLKPDGNVVMVGVIDDTAPRNTACMVEEMDTNLASITNFGETGGGRHTNFTNANGDGGRCDAVAVDTNNKIYIAGGVTHNSSDYDMAIARLDSGGDFDTLLYGNGAIGYNVFVPYSNPFAAANERALTLELQNGRALVGGISEPFANATPANSDMVFVRLDEYDLLFAHGFE